jgi:hypothetical protein
MTFQISPSLGATLVTLLVAVACSRAETGEAVDSSQAAPVTQLVAVDSGAPRLLPRDEANESFRQFRSEALRALARKDTAYLYGMLAPEIRNSFGGDDSLSGFKRIWKMEDPQTDVWTALTRVLTMGGQQSTDSSFTAPYVFAFWPDSMDSFGHVAVLGDAIRVLDAPTADARVLGSASNSILKFREWRGMPESGVAADTTWAQLELPDGTAGWIRGASVYSPVSWRAMFIRRGDRWQMVLFVAGD